MNTEQELAIEVEMSDLMTETVERMIAGLESLGKENDELKAQLAAHQRSLDYWMEQAENAECRISRQKERIDQLEAQLAKIERLADCSSTKAFLALSDEQKAQWFVTTGQRDKWARERVKELEAQLEKARKARELREKLRRVEKAAGLVMRLAEHEALRRSGPDRTEAFAQVQALYDALSQPYEAEKAKGEPSNVAAECPTMGRPRKECGCPDCGSSLIDFPSPD